MRRGEIARPGDVEVRGLPLLFSSDTLRIRPAEGAVSNLEETVRLESKPAPLPPSEEEREKLLLDIARVDDELHVVDVMLEALRASHPELLESKTLEPKLVDAKAWLEVLAVSRHEGAALARKRLTLEQRRRDLEHERIRLDERTRKLVEPEAPRVLRGVRFTVDASGPFQLEYFVHAARWVPTYALQLTSPRAGDPKPQTHARLVTAALVAQASGEDWSNAQLSVSTVDLARETTLPTLSSWRIGRAQPAQQRGFRPLPSDLPTLFAGYDRGPRRPSVPAATLPPTTIAATPMKPRPATGARSGAGAGVGAGTDALARQAPRDHEATVEMESVPESLDDNDYSDAYDSGEARAFERERSSNARPSLKSSMAFEEAVTDPDGYDVEDMKTAAPRSSRGPSAAPAPGAMPMAAPKGGMMFAQALSGGFGGAAGGRADEQGGGVVRAQVELPPRWRTASMRMAGPDEHGTRGALLPLDPIARLSWLLEAHDVDGVGRSELQRAIRALQQAQQRMEQAPLPRGTSLLLGTSLQSVMRASAATDVPGDGTFYRVEVRVDEGAAIVEHRCVPRASNDVWRTCRLDVKGAVLPPGPLAVYEDGAFKVNARLDLPAPSSTTTTSPAPTPHVQVNLGIDPDVRVLARTVHLRQAEKGLMSQTSRVEHDIDVEVRNTRKEPARLIVHDRLPVPADNVKDVVVNVIEEKPPIARTDKDAAGHDVKGAFEWRVSIMPGDTQHLVLKYAIDLPAKAELEGGNRRE